MYLDGKKRGLSHDKHPRTQT